MTTLLNINYCVVCILLQSFHLRCNFKTISKFSSTTLAETPFLTNVALKKYFSKYRRPSLFADFLFANYLIHISNLVKNDSFLVKNRLFSSKFKICGPKCWNVSTANNEGNLYKTNNGDVSTHLRYSVYQGLRLNLGKRSKLLFLGHFWPLSK